MRLDEPFVYRVTDVREPLPIFKFLMRAGPIDVKEAYATFNMGIGFAVYVSPDDAQACLRVAKETGYDAWIGGTVHKDGNRKAVEIEQFGITFDAESLKVR
jgi:phosphoribosylformylglycinamidine cyclo-ligase